jgi:hypothetical protein
MTGPVCLETAVVSPPNSSQSQGCKSTMSCAFPVAHSLTHNCMDGFPMHLAFHEDVREVAEDRDGGKEVAANVIDHTCQSRQSG